ncbi:MAG: dTDP-4-dehydrorhamnose reductase [Hyphomicrobiaceae bacterium]
MKVLVIGTEGQLARSLREAVLPAGVTLESLGRPCLDLADAAGAAAAVERVRPGLVVNAAAYTAVDRAESDADAAFAINAAGPEALARACDELGMPLLHVSTDYVFDGSKPAPYVEDDPVAPLGVYGRSKLEGEQRVAVLCPRHLILRTAWVYSPFGNNFVKTMLRLAGTRDEIAVVDDQIGNPTYAPHLADAILALAGHLAEGREVAWGIYHAAGTGDVTWCGLAREVFVQSARHGGPVARVRAITTAEYPTPARRPANSRLDCGRLRQALGHGLPAWQSGIENCVARLLGQPATA